MVYFSKFPFAQYDFTAATDPQPIIETGVDISTRISLNVSAQDFYNLTQKYSIGNNELPEHVSNKFYGTPDLAWVILYINNIGNINNEWPLSDIALNEFVASKYGVSNINVIHHYEKLPEGLQMDQSFIVTNYGQSALNIVTNTDYEAQLNDQKRLIYIIKPENIGSFVKQYFDMLSA